jgi:hypothetical protein
LHPSPVRTLKAVFPRAKPYKQTVADEKKKIKRNPLIDKNQKKRSKDKSSYRSVKAKPFGFGQKSPPSHTRVVFLPKALTALPSFLDAYGFLFFGFLLKK